MSDEKVFLEDHGFAALLYLTNECSKLAVVLYVRPNMPISSLAFMAHARCAHENTCVMQRADSVPLRSLLEAIQNQQKK